MWPVVYGAKQQYGDRVQIVILDYYSPKNDEIKKQYRAFGHPTFVFVDQAGKEQARLVGLAPPEKVHEAFAKIAG